MYREERDGEGEGDSKVRWLSGYTKNDNELRIEIPFVGCECE